MIQERKLEVEGTCYSIVISDEPTTLLAAKAAGRVVIGLWNQEGTDGFLPVKYAVEDLRAITEDYLERVVRRQLGLPWTIGETTQLFLREFSMEDSKMLMEYQKELSLEFRTLTTEEGMNRYIQHQYGFYEYGIWAVVRKLDGEILGTAGVTACDIQRKNEEQGRAVDMQLELGYHIFGKYEGNGYATQACRIILDYVKKEFDCPVYAVVDSKNQRSIKVLNRLGFQPMEQRYNEERKTHCLYEWNC